MTNIFVSIGSRFGLPKSVIWGIISAIIIGGGSLSFAFIKTTAETNAELPNEKQKINLTNQKVDALQIDMEVLKTDVSNMKQSVTDVKKEQESQRDLLLQILFQARQINTQTRER